MAFTLKDAAWLCAVAVAALLLLRPRRAPRGGCGGGCSGCPGGGKKCGH